MPRHYLRDTQRVEMAIPAVLLRSYVDHPEVRVAPGTDGVEIREADYTVAVLTHTKLIALMLEADKQLVADLPPRKAKSLRRRAATEAFAVAAPLLDGRSAILIGATLWHFVCDLGAIGQLDVHEGSPAHEALTLLREMIGYGLENPEVDGKAAENARLMIEGYRRRGHYQEPVRAAAE